MAGLTTGISATSVIARRKGQLRRAGLNRGTRKRNAVKGVGLSLSS